MTIGSQCSGAEFRFRGTDFHTERTAVPYSVRFLHRRWRPRCWKKSSRPFSNGNSIVYLVRIWGGRGGLGGLATHCISHEILVAHMPLSNIPIICSLTFARVLCIFEDICFHCYLGVFYSLNCVRRLHTQQSAGLGERVLPLQWCATSLCIRVEDIGWVRRSGNLPIVFQISI